MSYGELGGNGSVHWLIDADDVDDDVEKSPLVASVRRNGEREWRQHGVDYHGKMKDVGDNFTIRIKLPKDKKKRTEWLARMRRHLASAGTILEFKLPIVKSKEPHTQIQICWGKTCAWEDNLHRLSTELKAGSLSGSAPQGAPPSV